MKRGFYKRVDELSAWDLDSGCRHFVNQDSPANRRLKARLRKQGRRRLARELVRHELASSKI